ncbi:MAG TPA: hypothetical protein VHP34_05840 [Alphaproteobacteria bacterium]|jgi:hypothetical protein|nr:hypothetical protein [Alphaproteobacteria bacterium]
MLEARNIIKFFVLYMTALMLVSFILPPPGAGVCGTLLLIAFVPYVAVADERFATARQIKWGYRFCGVLLVLNILGLMGALFAYVYDLRPWALGALPAAAGIAYVLSFYRSLRCTRFRPPSALLCTQSEKRFLHRAAVWERIAIFPEAIVVMSAIFGLNDLWRGYGVPAITFLALAGIALVLSIWVRRLRRNALEVATAQASYRDGTVGQVLHPAFMSPTGRIVPTHIRK